MKTLNPNPERSLKLKRFLVFMGSVFYPCGGWNDFKGDFSSLDEAKSFILNAENDWASDWAQIFDTKTRKIVWTESNC